MAIALILAAVVGVIVLGYNINSDKMNDVWMDVIKSTLQTFVGTIIIGTITKMIGDHIIKIAKNDSKLKQYGIQRIKTGKSTRMDIIDLFGSKQLGDYPKEIGLMFITGNGFLRYFKEELINAINHGTNVKLLVADYNNDIPSNSDFLERGEYLCKQDPPYWSQLHKETVKYVDEINDCVKNNASAGKFEIAFYKDEYRFNYRYAVYEEKKYIKSKNIEEIKEVYKMWLNIQPSNKDAVDLSVVLNGNLTVDESSEITNGQADLSDSENILYQQYLSFNNLWDKYSAKT